ncbi:response regulator transcription factor [Acidobacteria bacterium AB60]|nr:response regulator transcription factor [Acidobacteria bacterium AB60]
MVIQTLLADDEPLARRKLREFLQADADVKIVGEAGSGAEVMDLIRKTNPQVMFLDVKMPGQDGFAVLEEIAAEKSMPMPSVIITTAYDQYALKAFDARAVDYLLKPFTMERLRAAVQRVKDQLSTAPAKPEKGPETREQEYLNRLVFKSKGRILFLPATEIRWIGAEENYVRISNGTESHLLRDTISSMEQRLDPKMFLRVHRSAIVNLNHVKEIRTDTKGDFVVQLLNGHIVPMSRSYHARIRHLLGRWMMRPKAS